MARAEWFGMYQNDLTLAELIAWVDPFAEYRPIRLDAVSAEINAYEIDCDYVASMLLEDAP